MEENILFDNKISSNNTDDISSDIIDELLQEGSIQDFSINNSQLNEDKEKKYNSKKENHGFPLARVKRIMKADPEVELINSDALFLVSKATELFLEYFVDESLKHTKKAKRKIVQLKDLEKCISEQDGLEFLTDLLKNKDSLASNKFFSKSATGSSTSTSKSNSDINDSTNEQPMNDRVSMETESL